MTAKIKVNLSGLRNMERELNNITGGRKSPAADQWRKAATTAYLEYARKEFVSNSKGGGSWPPLADSTVSGRRYQRGKTIGGARRGALARARRAKSARSATGIVRTLERVAKAAGSVAILRDTGTLFRSLLQGAPGNLVRAVRGGVEVGIGGGRHPGGGMSLGQLAYIHHFGKGHNPARRIVPDRVPTEVGNRIGRATKAALMLAVRRGFRRQGGGGS